MNEYDLDQASQPANAADLARAYFHADLLRYEQVGQGFYGVVYQAAISQPPHQVIFKWHKLPGAAAQEAGNLALMRRYGLLKVPEVYATHVAAPPIPFECLLMEVLPGVVASKVQFPSSSARQAFVEAIVDNLLTLHAVHNPAGFGDPDGPFYPTWQAFYHTRIQHEYQAILPLTGAEDYPPLYRRLVVESYAAFKRILRHANPKSSLIHSDYNIWNFMADPQTGAVTGVIDPMTTCWADRELDLFQLYNGPGRQLGLLEHYLRSYPPDDEFFLRSSFYRFWDDVHHYNLLPGPLRAYILQEVRPYAERLDAEMKRWL